MTCAEDGSSILVVCDASDAFGFGVSVAPCAPEVTREVGRLGSKRDVFVRLDRDGVYLGEEAERPRTGTRLPVAISMAAFSTVVSSRAKHAAHSGALEAHGVTLALR